MGVHTVDPRHIPSLTLTNYTANRINHETRTPILPLPLGLLIHPQQASRHHVVNDGPAPRPVPGQVVPQHAHAHVAQDLDGLDDGGLVVAELLGHAAHVLFSADLEDRVAPAEGLQGADSAADVVFRDLAGALHAALGDPVAKLREADEPAILPSCRAAHLDDADRKLKVKVIDTAPQQLRPQSPSRRRRSSPSSTTTPVRMTARQGIDADGVAHARKLRAEARVGADVLGVRLRELLEDGAEDGELRSEGLGVAGAEVGAVGGEVGGCEARAVKGADTDAFARHGWLFPMGGDCVGEFIVAIPFCEVMKVGRLMIVEK